MNWPRSVGNVQGCADGEILLQQALARARCTYHIAPKRHASPAASLGAGRMRHALEKLGSLLFPEEFMNVGFFWEMGVLAERERWDQEQTGCTVGGTDWRIGSSLEKKHKEAVLG